MKGLQGHTIDNVIVIEPESTTIAIDPLLRVVVVSIVVVIIAIVVCIRRRP